MFALVFQNSLCNASFSFVEDVLAGEGVTGIDEKVNMQHKGALSFFKQSFSGTYFSFVSLIYNLLYLLYICCSKYLGVISTGFQGLQREKKEVTAIVSGNPSVIVDNKIMTISVENLYVYVCIICGMQSVCKPIYMYSSCGANRVSTYIILSGEYLIRFR